MEGLVADCLAQILLRVPADRPEILPRCNAVCKEWRLLLTDPRFIHQYRAFNGLPHLLGYVHDDNSDRRRMAAKFVTTAATTTVTPRMPHDGVDFHVLNSCHGRVIFQTFPLRWIDPCMLVVWDCVADHHEMIHMPRPFRDHFMGAVRGSFHGSHGHDPL